MLAIFFMNNDCLISEKRAPLVDITVYFQGIQPSLQCALQQDWLSKKDVEGRKKSRVWITRFKTAGLASHEWLATSSLPDLCNLGERRNCPGYVLDQVIPDNAETAWH